MSLVVGLDCDFCPSVLVTVVEPDDQFVDLFKIVVDHADRDGWTATSNGKTMCPRCRATRRRRIARMNHNRAAHTDEVSP